MVYLPSGCVRRAALSLFTFLALSPHMAAVPSSSENSVTTTTKEIQISGDSRPAVSPHVETLVKEVLAWQRRIHNLNRAYPWNGHQSEASRLNCWNRLRRLWYMNHTGKVLGDRSALTNRVISYSAGSVMLVMMMMLMIVMVIVIMMMIVMVMMIMTNLTFLFLLELLPRPWKRTPPIWLRTASLAR